MRMNRRALLKSGLAAAGYATLHTTTPDWMCFTATSTETSLAPSRSHLQRSHAAEVNAEIERFLAALPVVQSR